MKFNESTVITHCQIFRKYDEERTFETTDNETIRDCAAFVTQEKKALRYYIVVTMSSYSEA
eukprot:m.8749 g.8749  ORF g.8749 m.8749 type:complete len:61 (+) comp6194_c0_seq2:869-1051(+)